MKQMEVFGDQKLKKREYRALISKKVIMKGQILKYKSDGVTQRMFSSDTCPVISPIIGKMTIGMRMLKAEMMRRGFGAENYSARVISGYFI